MSLCHLCKSKTKLLYNLSNFHYFFCSNCTTLFLHPIPKEKEIKTYYKKSFKYTAGEVEEKRIRSRSKKILKKLKEMNPDRTTLLDIGSGYGYFLEEAQTNGFVVIGTEPSKSLYNYSESNVKKYILNADFDDFIKKSKTKYDFVTLIHVIEHLPDPKKTLKQIVSLLKPDGILYIETPNINSWLAKIEKENYTFLIPLDHIWLFSLQSFRELLRNFHNVRIQNISTYSYPEHFMGILKNKLRVKSEKLKVINENLKLDIDSKLKIKNLKFIKEKINYYLFDKIIAPICTPLLNIGGYGSILELYIKKIK